MTKCEATVKLLLTSVILQVLCTLHPHLTDLLAFSPSQGLGSILGLITHMVSHGGWDHLIGNFSFGLPFMLYLESKLGKKAFLEYYFICGLASAALNTLMMGTALGMIGSSGAIMGVAIGACLAFGETRLQHALGLAMAACLIIPQLAAAPMAELIGVAVYGHIGGALCAMLLSSRLYQNKKLS